MERRELRNTQTIRLDISEYDAWRDFLHAGAFSSSDRFAYPYQQITARYAWEIGQKTVFGLREGNERIYCGDEYTDAEVLMLHDPDKRREMFRQALEKTLFPLRTEPQTVWKDRIQGDWKYKHIDAFFAAGSIMGQVLLGIDEEESVALVHSQMVSTHMISKFAVSLFRFKNRHLKSQDKQSHEVHNMIFMSSTREAVASQILSGGADRGLIDAIVPGKTIQLGDGDIVTMVGSEVPSYELDKESELLIAPMIEAIHYGRMEMIDQAKELAYQYLGVIRPLQGEDDRRQPPEHWTSERIIPLRSDEILVWVPSGLSTSHMIQNENPKAVIVDLLLELAYDDPGWYLLRITKGEPIAVVMTTRLTS